MVGTATALEGAAGVVPTRELQRALGPCVGCAAEILFGSGALVSPVQPPALEVRVGLVQLRGLEVRVVLVQFPRFEARMGHVRLLGFEARVVSVRAVAEWRLYRVCHLQ